MSLSASPSSLLRLRRQIRFRCHCHHLYKVEIKKDKICLCVHTWAYIVWIDGIAARAKKVSRICFSSLICLFVFFAFVLLRFLESASEWSNADFRDSDLKGVRNALHMSNSEISSHKPYIKWVWPLEPMTVKWSNYGESLPKMHYVAFIKLMVSQLRCLMNMLNLNDMPLIMIIENAPPKIISKLRLMQMMLNIKENTFFCKNGFIQKSWFLLNQK